MESQRTPNTARPIPTEHNALFTLGSDTEEASSSSVTSSQVGSLGSGGTGSWGNMAAANGRRRRSTALSRRNSSVWLASMSMDVHHMHRAPHVSQINLPTFSTPAPYNGGAKPALNNLPIEIITLIVQYLAVDINGLANLYRVLATCGRLYDVGVAALYRHVIFRYPQTFDKFRWSIEESDYGQHVRVLDFSAFTSVGLGRTSRMNMEIQMVADTTIYRVLELCPQINEFLAAESIDTDLSAGVLDKLLTMPVLNALDFCGATAPPFVEGLRGSLVMAPEYQLWNLTKLSLHCCSTIPANVLENLMPKLVNITRLDLTHTQIEEQALLSLPQSAKLTHLSLSRCYKLTSHSIVKFLVLHPATKNLRWLSLMFEATKPIPLSRHDFDTIMRFLPRTIRHVNLSGLPVTEQHLFMLNYEQLRSLSIRYAPISIAALYRFLPLCTNLTFIDLTKVPGITSWTMQDQSFLNLNKNIEMFEVSQEILESLRGVHIPGFVVDPGRGRRGWLHRIKTAPLTERDPSRTDLRPITTFSFAQHAIERMNKAKAATTVPSPSLDGPPPPWDPVWRFASHKINVSEIGIGGVPGPATLGHEGIYNYYALNSI